MTIREMRPEDASAVVEMMRVFYTSPAVWTNGSEEIFQADVAACVGSSPFLEGYVFEQNGQLCGYAMVAHSFSTEFGRPCLWLEDLYLLPASRGKGLGTEFFSFLEQAHPGVLLRLEVEAENERAVALYQKCGFEVLPYMEMKKAVAPSLA